MKLKSISSALLIAALFTLFSGCEKSTDQHTQVLKDNTEISKDEFFKGVIILKEKDAISSKSTIKIILNGNDVQRDVNGIGDVNYGMIYKKGEDSVLYYYKKDKKYYHTAIEKKDFQKWVDNLERPKMQDSYLSNNLKEPFGTIFSPFADPGGNILIKTFKADLKNYGSAECQTFAIGTHLICNVFYSENIKIKPEILGMLEYYQPTSVSTIALQVKYTASKNNNSVDIPNKILDKLHKVAVKLNDQLFFESAENSTNVSIGLPANSSKVSIEEMSSIINPPIPSNGKSSSHDHDFF